MKILYIGNYHQPWTTETYISQTLTDMGHDVDRLQEDTIHERDIYNRAKNCEMVLWTRTWPAIVSFTDLEDIKSLGIPSVSFHLDYYIGLPREARLDVEPFWRTDHVFTVDGDPKHAEIFKAKGINHHYSPAGVYKGDCHKGHQVDEYTHDIVFLGGAENYPKEDWPYRMQLITWLRETYGSRFQRYPLDDSVRLWGEDMNNLFASAKIVMGDTMCLDNLTQQNCWSDRIYETTGRGGFIIHPYIGGLEKEFRDRIEVPFYHYGDFEELKGLIDFYLNNPEIREKIRENGMARTKKDHTYENRMTELLRVVNET